MATTQNTYTGNGSLTEYSFTFPYLEESDVKVSLDGVVKTQTTDYTFANATTISFNTAPGSGVAIRIYRSTDQDSPPATFFAGSAIRAQDLNENFLQQLYIAQETTNATVAASTGNLAENSITGFELADNSVGTIILVNSSVTTAKLDDSSVTTAKLDDSSVTTAKLDNSSVTSAKIADGTIVNADVNASAAIAATKLSFTQSGTGATARTVDSKLKDVVSVKDFGAVGDGVTDDTAAFTNAIAASNHVIVPIGTYAVGSMIELGAGKTLQLQATATIIRKTSISASTDPVIWLKGIRAQVLGAGQHSSSIQTENACPKGVVRIGHEDMSSSHDNVTYCTLADIGIFGSIDGGQTSGSPDIAVYMVSKRGTHSSYFHSVRNLRIGQTNCGILLQGDANANNITGITGQNIGNAGVSLYRAMLFVHGCADNRISDFFFHLSSNTDFMVIEDLSSGGDNYVSSMNSFNNMVCEQGGTGRWLVANASCTATYNYIQGIGNVSSGPNLSTQFKKDNTVIYQDFLISRGTRTTTTNFFKASNDATYVGETSTYHELRSDVAASPTLLISKSGTPNGTTAGISISYSDSAPNDTTKNFLYCADTVGLKASIRSNGGLANFSANNVNLSDIRTKKNISNLDSTWNCVKDWEIIKYLYNHQNDDETPNVGVIAQQLEVHCPEVISPFQEAEEGVEELLGVNEPKMMWMAIKALQEAQQRIETLEAQVQTLSQS